MSRKQLAGILVATVALAVTCVARVIAEGNAAAALTGVVSSQADGPMEGVLVGAKRAGSTISTWVVSNAQGESIPFDVQPFRKYCLLNGFDDIGLTLRHADKIKAFEVERIATKPWLNNRITR